MMFLKTSPLMLLICAPFFVAAGRLDVPFGWAYVAVIWACVGTVYTVMLHKSPALLEERLRPPTDRDRGTRRVVVPVLLAHWALAGLDARFGWSAAPSAVRLAGLALVAAALALSGWTLLTNPFASSAVRIQSERGQHVVSSGPYAFVRHPMYLGVLIASLGSGLALGSWLAGLLLVPVVAVFVRRTLKEDAMLHHELTGYRDYAARVRWRVLPYVF